MTEQQRLTIRAELARRMGWDFIQSPSEIALPDTGEWYTPFGRNYGSEPPDPFTNAEDNRALVLWLKGQGNVVQVNFWGELDLLINNPLLLIPVNGQLVYSPLEYLTLPLEAITLAACKALGIETE